VAITLNLPVDLEQRLRESEARGDEQAFRALLVEAVAPGVRKQLHQRTSSPLSLEEFEAAANRLAERFGVYNKRTTPLPEDAYSRASIYADHDGAGTPVASYLVDTKIFLRG
jgi:hypothetical protein